MNAVLKSKILESLGTLDGRPMLFIFKSIGIKDDVKFDNRGLNIPTERVKDFGLFKQALSKLSKTGRAFPVKESNERIFIDIYSMTEHYINHYKTRKGFFGDYYFQTHRDFLYPKKLSLANPIKVKELIDFIEAEEQIPTDFSVALLKGINLAKDMYEVTQTGPDNPYRKQITFIASDKTKGDGVNPESMDYFMGDQYPWMSLIVPELKKRGFEVEIVSWEDPTIEWKYKLLVFIGPIWGYTQNLKGFENFLNKLEQEKIRVFNDIKFIQWTYTKSYLLDLEKWDIRIPPTLLIEPNSDTTVEQILNAAREKWGTRDVVFKAVVGAAGLEYRRIDPEKIFEAEKHLEVLKKENKGAVVQPFLPNIGIKGEFSFVFFGEQLSHFYVKVPPKGKERVQKLHGGESFHIDESDIKGSIEAIKIFNNNISISENELLYAKKQVIEIRKKLSTILKSKGIPELVNIRIDVVIDKDGVMVMELEGIEAYLEWKEAMKKSPGNNVVESYKQKLEQICRTAELTSISFKL